MTGSRHIHPQFGVIEANASLTRISPPLDNQYEAVYSFP